MSMSTLWSQVRNKIVACQGVFVLQNRIVYSPSFKTLCQFAVRSSSDVWNRGIGNTTINGLGNKKPRSASSL